MAAHRIIRVSNNNHILPRCKSEGTLIDLSEGVTSASLSDVKGQRHFGFILCDISWKPCFSLHLVALRYSFVYMLHIR